MSDDLDDLLRRAMKTLADQAPPPGYFEDFPSRTLARLEDGSMQDEPHDAIGASSSSDLSPAGTAATATAAPAAAPADTAAPAPEPTPTVATAEPAAAEPAPPAPRPREEDSGLHDIRNLASSQRMRLSSRRTSQGSIRTDDELLATSSGSWKAVALPEPAKMVSLPELADLPPASGAGAHDADRAARGEATPKAAQKAEKAAQKAEKAAQKAEKAEARAEARAEAKAEAKAAEPRAAAAAASGKAAARPREAAAAVEPPAQVTPITAAKARPKAAAPSSGSGKRTAMIVAAGLAAAAGAVIVVSTQSSKSDDAAREAAAPAAGSSMQLPELRRVEPRSPAPVAAPDPAATAGSAAAVAAPAPAESAADKGKAAAPPPEKPGKSIGKYVPNVVETPQAPDKKKDDAKKKPEPGDPDFDKLLQEAGYQEKKADGPKLEKKSLSGDDIKKGMNAVTSKVSSCYAGQQGTASVRLTVLPTGQVQKVTVSGVFAGTPVGACVEGAVQLATFPPWDGGPQSINYSYLLAE